MRVPLSTMPPLRQWTPPLGPQESLVLRDQGGYRFRACSGWKVVDCLLTDHRLILCQLRRVLLEIPLASIGDLKTETHYYVLRKREAIGVCFVPPGGGATKTIWLILNGAPVWKVRLFQGALLTVDEALISRLGERLDDSSMAILWHLWEHRHARIVTLAKVCGAEDHMDVLTHIKDAINPVAMKQIGCPLLLFDRRRVDPQTGEVVLFSWWFAGGAKPPSDPTERLMDIFDEGDYFQVIVEVKKASKSDLLVSVEGKTLTVESRHPRARWTERFPLPGEVVFGDHRISLKHSLLEIRLEKAPAHAGHETHQA